MKFIIWCMIDKLNDRIKKTKKVSTIFFFIYYHSIKTGTDAWRPTWNKIRAVRQEEVYSFTFLAQVKNIRAQIKADSHRKRIHMIFSVYKKLEKSSRMLARRMCISVHEHHSCVAIWQCILTKEWAPVLCKCSNSCFPFLGLSVLNISC